MDTFSILCAKNPVRDEQAAEHQALGDEEQPHPLLRRFELVIRGFEVMRVMVFDVTF
jgi:hypothetical protein